MQILAKRARFLEDAAAEEHRWLEQIGAFFPPYEQIFAPGPTRLAQPGRLAIAKVFLAVPINDRDLRPLKFLSNRVERPRQILIIRVQPADDFALRPVKSFVQSIRLPAILLSRDLQMGILR